MVKNLREPVNGITHLIGAMLSLIALVAMVLKLVNSNVATPLAYISVFAFGIGMVLLYGASATYHSIISTDFYINNGFICPILFNSFTQQSRLCIIYSCC